MFSLGRVVLYTVFMICVLPQTLVKTLAKNLDKKLANKLVKNLHNGICPRNVVREIDRTLTENHFTNLQKTCLELLPKNPKLQIESFLDFFSYGGEVY